MGILCLQSRRFQCMGLLKEAPPLVQNNSLAYHPLSIAAILNELLDQRLMLSRKLFCQFHRGVCDEICRLTKDNRLQVLELQLKLSLNFLHSFASDLLILIRASIAV